jgi:polysaccharide biosynthesis/export protein
MRLRSLPVPLFMALSLFAAPVHGVSQGSGSQADDLVLQPGDILRITVWPEQGLGGEFVVEESGFVYLPYLQAVRAAGVSIDELRAELRLGYSETIRNPVVSITPVFRVTVMGEVQRPGVYSITPSSTLFDVIGLAGGFRLEADQERLRVVRPGQVVEYDALRALEFGENMDAVSLRSGDQVVVPRADPGFNWRGALTVIQTISILAVTWERFSR